MSDLLREIDSLALFRGVRYAEPLNSLCDFLKKMEAGYTIDEMIEAYGTFVSVLYSMPEWICRMWLDRYGFDKTEEMLKFFLLPRPTCRCYVGRAPCGHEPLPEAPHRYAC